MSDDLRQRAEELFKRYDFLYGEESEHSRITNGVSTILAFADEVRKAERKRVRKIFTDRLNLTDDQRAYSWHGIQDALEAIERDDPIQAHSKPAGNPISIPK